VRLLLLVLMMAVLTSCVASRTFPYPDLPPAENAKLIVEPTSAFQFFFMPDGYKCGSYLKIANEQNPFVRSDKTLIVEAKKRQAIQLVWAQMGHGACDVIVAFELAPGGTYKLKSALDQNSCMVALVPQDPKSRIGFMTQRMVWTGLKLPSECKPAPSS